jgi:hypothetical protein
LLLEFIELRDVEKAEESTLVEAPTISPEGKATGGILTNARSGKSFEFVGFLDQSYHAVVEFTGLVLGNSKE